VVVLRGLHVLVSAMSRRANFLPSLALALLLGASILAVQPAAGYPVSATQQSQVEGVLEDSAPALGEWQIATTTNRFWFQSGVTDESQFFSDGSALVNPLLDTAGPTVAVQAPDNVAATPVQGGNRVARIDATGVKARFPMHETLAAVEPYNYLGSTTKILGACDVGGIYGALPVTPQNNAPTGITQAIIVQKLVGGTWTDQRTLTTIRLEGDGIVWAHERATTLNEHPYAVQQFKGSAPETDQLRGAVVDVGVGERLLVEFSLTTAASTNAQCFLYYGVLHTSGNGPNCPIQFTIDNTAGLLLGGLPRTGCNRAEFSEFNLVTDAARLAVYTTAVSEDGTGVGPRRLGFPSGLSADSSERKLVVEALYASAIGPGIVPQLMEQRHANVRILDVESQTPLYYVDSSNNLVPINSAFPATSFPWEYNFQTLRLDSPGADDVVPQPAIKADLGSSVVRRSYQFSYGDNVTELLDLQAQFYSFSDGWEVGSDRFAIGGKGIEFALASSETALHLINKAEPTQFVFVVSNVGTEDDVVTVTAADPGNGWSATVLGGGLVFVRAGGVALVLVEVLPPPTANTGSATVTVRASSSFADVPDPSVETVTARLTSEVVRQVNLIAMDNSFVVRPGVQKAVSVTLRNEGTARDSFVILPQLPANTPGWTVQMSPASIQLDAGAIAQIQALVTPPAEAPSGTSITMGLTAVEVGNASIAKRVDITLNVLSAVGVSIGDAETALLRTMRDDNNLCRTTGEVGEVYSTVEDATIVLGRCFTSDTTGERTFNEFIPDTDFDRTALFRIPITNHGDQTESFRIQSFWDTGVAGSKDGAGCDGAGGGNRDGVPDGWRFNWDEDVGGALPTGKVVGSEANNQGYSGRYQLQGLDDPLVVPARTTVIKYLEIGNINSISGSGCGGSVSETVSATAAMRVTATSIRDSALVSSMLAVVKVDAPGDFERLNEFTGAKHLVSVGLENGQPSVEPVQVPYPSNDPNFAIFDVRASNVGNELDGIVLRVTGSAGWAHSIVYDGDSTPDGITCAAPREDGTVVCSNLGIHDEVRFKVVALPPATADPGDVDTIVVTVASVDTSGSTDRLEMTARAVGTFAFTAGPRGESSTRTGVPGATVPLPFVIRNIGTEADTYRASLLISDPAWLPVLSTGAGLFVPAINDGAGYLAVTIPDGATVGTTKQFRIAVDSTTTGARQVFDVFANVVAPGRLVITSVEGQDVLLAERGSPQPVEVQATLVTGSATPIRLAADQLGLPQGWAVTPTVVPELILTPDSNGRPTAKATFMVTAPSNAISTSRGVLHITGTDASGNEPALRATTDLVLNLASTFGLDLNTTETQKIIAPGGDAVFQVKLSNLGLGPDTVRFTNTALPEGWRLSANPASVGLGPLQNQTVEVTLSAPTTAQPKDIASVVLFATSLTDPTTLDSVQLSAQVGFNELKAVLTSQPPYAGPQETLTYALNVTNTGTLPDEVRIGGALDSVGLRDHIVTTVTPTSLVLEPGETVEVILNQALGAKIPSGAVIQGSLAFTSLLDERTTPASASVTFVGHVLEYATTDLNGDGNVEYAVDRDRDDSNGFEQFQATKTPGGLPLALPDLQKFLRDDARDSFSRDVTLDDGTVQRVLVYTIDGDKDGRVDHFLDKDGDDLPDFYWDPDANKASAIEFRKDINGDQVPDLFVDVDGEGSLDAVFDLTRGTFTDVLQVDVDGDGELDYVVDKDGDGVVDQDETVLYTRTGKLLIVQKVDVDGDGKLDQVFDVDGDGNPDYFIPNGSTASVPIVLRDVNGDGVQDWTFDGDGDGRNESYYDPATGKAHVIDAAGHFTEALAKYWYIGALFALVLVLFVALVLVTRR
jgi:uncharacterized membrane protein